MGYTSDPQERLQRVRRAILVFNWMILELEQQNSKKKNKCPQTMTYF